MLYFLTSITALWLVDLLLSGFVFREGPTTVLMVALFVLASIYLTEQIISRTVKKSTMLLFFVFGLFLTFFSFYIATLVLSDFNVVSGSLSSLNLKITETPTITKMDQVLSLLLGSLITMIIAVLTRWASKSSKGEA